MKTSNLSEQNFEDEYVVKALQENDYLLRNTKDHYDKDLCLDGELLLDFVQSTQPDAWSKYDSQRKDAEEKLLSRVDQEIRQKGIMHVLRNGVKDRGHHFDLLSFQPASGLNPEHQQIYEANQFSVINQLQHSNRNPGRSIDVVLFLNGIPLFTMELKNKFTGQDVHNAINQYKHTRNPSEPLFNKTIAHFAVDNDEVYYTTNLAGEDTEFLPFNKDIENPLDERGFRVAYLYRDIFEPDSVLNLLQNFIQKVEKEDDSFLVFPRYHQLDTVRRVMGNIEEHGAGKDFLIQHSAGSGKTFTISWLAHQLSEIHDEDDERVFNSVLVVSDRRVIDKQLKSAVYQFEQTPGTVQWAEKAKDLRKYLENGVNIIATTVQKFPYALEKMEKLSGSKFAVLIDEAHSGQGGITAQKMNETLQYDSLEEAEESEANEPTLEDEIVADIKSRQRTTEDISYFAFTATPKEETLELFGDRNEQGNYGPFSLYSMRQAIEEGFIVDVLQNYISYKNYFELSKKIEHDPEYEKRKAKPQLVRYANLDKNAIQKKTQIMLDHFAKHTKHQIGGQGKAMLVTRSRLHVVKFKREFDRQLRERDDIETNCIGAFSGVVEEEGVKYRESNLNDFPPREIKSNFDTDEYRILIVASKFQTGFDQPLLETMWVDKSLSGVNAVQTLSRLNRTHPGKDSVSVIDFINDPGKIQESFQPYYETKILTEETDPNVLYDFEHEILQKGLIDRKDVEDFMSAWFGSEKQDELHRYLAPTVKRYSKLEDDDEKSHFRGLLRRFVKQYEYIIQLVEFQDDDLHQLYLYSKFLVKKLPVDSQSLPREIVENVDMSKYALNKQFEGTIELMDKPEEVEAENSVPKGGSKPEEDKDALSNIINEINELFGGEVFEDEEHAKKKFEDMAENLKEDDDLMETIESNPKEDSKLKFEDKFSEQMSNMYESDFDFYQKLEENKSVKDKVKSWIFEKLVG